jgi:hypothetical protein
MQFCLLFLNVVLKQLELLKPPSSYTSNMIFFFTVDGICLQIINTLVPYIFSQASVM